MKKRILAIIIPLITLTAALLVLIPIVRAEENAVQFQFVDSVTLTDTSGNSLPLDSISKTSGVRLNYHFTLPDITPENNYGIVPGANYYMEIPPQVLITDALAKQTIPLNDSNGDTVANCTLQKGASGSNSKVIITFTDYVLTHSEVTGSFYLQSSFDQTQIGNANPVPVVFNIGNSQSQTVYLNFQQPEVKVAKNCSAYNKTDNTITWTVTLNPENVTVNNGVFTDDIPEGLTYADSPQSFSITGSTSGALLLDSNFSYVADSGNTDPSKSGTLSYTLPTNTHETYTIIYKTKVTDSALFTGSGSITKTNTAVLKHDAVNGVTQATGSKVTTVTANLIKKDGAVSSNSDGTKKIDWTITVNQDQLNLSGAKVKDTIPDTLNIIDGTVKVNGVLLNAGDYSYVAHAFEYDFLANITTAQTITFSTSIVDPNYFFVNHDASSTFANSATIEATCDGNTVNVTKSSTNIPVTSTIITKSSQYIASDHVIKWTVTVNSNKTAINSAVVEDKIPAGLTLVEAAPYAVQSAAGYTFIDKDSDGTNDTLHFELGNLTSANSPVTLVYYTDVPAATVNAVNGTTYFDNTAYLTGKTTDGADVNASGYNRATVTSTVFGKTLSYDYAARLATWTITVNANAMDLPQAIVKDTIPAGQYIYIPDGKTLQDAVTVRNTTQNQAATNGTLTFTPTAAGDETQGGTLEYDFTKLSESDPYTITDTYTIVFKTKITDPTAFTSNGTIHIANTATLENGLVSTISAGRFIDITNKLASKTGTVDNNMGCVHWSVDINTNAALTLATATLTDVLADGLDLDTSSIKLIPLTINASSGALTEGTPVALTGANVSYNRPTRTFVFTLPPNTQSAYRLKFDTYVVKNITSVANSISFSGTSLSQSSAANVNGIVFAGAGGSGSGVTGSLTVTKVDADNPSTKLTGATFQLLDSYGNPYSDPQTVDANGQVVFDGLIYNTYKLHEITAPDGYLLAPDATVKVDASHKNISYTFQDPPKKGTVTVIKTDEKGTLLAGAQFALKDGSGNTVLTATSGADGKAVFNARLGSYTLVEAQAPANHLLNNTTYSIDITEGNYTTPQQYTYADDRMVGSFQVTKYSNKGGTLSGAEFTLYNGANVVQAATTGADGTVQFTDIPFGSYTLKETKAPNNYIKDSTEVPVTIDVSNYKTLQSFSFTNNKMEGDIEVTKTDLKGVPLAGAEFTLYDGSNNAVTTAVSGDDGIADFLNVPFGEYTIKETKAPDEYLVDTKTCPVSVDGLTYLTVQKLTFEDERMLGNIEILKTDKKGLPLANAEFSLFDSKGKIAYKAVSDKDGIAKFTDIFLGTYTLKETKAPAKHVLNTKEYSVTLDPLNYTVTQNYNFTNDIMQGDIKILKTGYKEALLPGAEFTLYDNDGKEYRSVQSDAGGVALFSGIPYGEYTFKETKAPENYLLNDTIYTVSINETTYSTVQPFSVADTPMLGKIVVVIKDDNDVPLSGGEFTLHDKDKNPVATSISGPDGTLTFNDVPVGNYTIKETKAPKGYRLIEDDIQVPLTSANYVQTQQFTVIYNKDDIIRTGDSNLLLMIAGGAGLLAVCVIVILVITDKRKNGNRFRV